MIQILCQTSDISHVPAEFVKNFLIMFAFVTVGAGAFLFGRRGSKGSPIHVEQPVNVDAKVTNAPVFAHQSALDALRRDMDTRNRENLRLYEDQAAKMAEIIKAGYERQETILKALNDMESRMTSATLEELKDIHIRLNPIGEKVAAHEQAIKEQGGRIQHLWEMIQSLWAQVFRKSAPRSS